MSEENLELVKRLVEAFYARDTQAALCSGVPVAQDIAILWTLRDGRVTHGKVYPDQRAARRAVGLSR